MAKERDMSPRLLKFSMRPFFRAVNIWSFMEKNLQCTPCVLLLFSEHCEVDFVQDMDEDMELILGTSDLK